MTQIWIIALGKTGVETVRLLRSAAQQRGTRDHNQRLHVLAVGFDPMPPDFVDEDYIQLARDVEPALDAVTNYSEQMAHVRGWVDPQMWHRQYRRDEHLPRPLERLIWVNDLALGGDSNIYRRWIQKLRQISAQSIKVFITCRLADEAGGALLVDAAHLTRTLAQNANKQLDIWGFTSLPYGYNPNAQSGPKTPQNSEQVRALAAYRELLRMMRTLHTDARQPMHYQPVDSRMLDRRLWNGIMDHPPLDLWHIFHDHPQLARRMAAVQSGLMVEEVQGADTAAVVNVQAKSATAEGLFVRVVAASSATLPLQQQIHAGVQDMIRQIIPDLTPPDTQTIDQSVVAFWQEVAPNRRTFEAALSRPDFEKKIASYLKKMPQVVDFLIEPNTGSTLSSDARDKENFLLHGLLPDEPESGQERLDWFKRQIQTCGRPDNWLRADTGLSRQIANLQQQRIDTFRHRLSDNIQARLQADSVLYPRHTHALLKRIRAQLQTVKCLVEPHAKSASQEQIDHLWATLIRHQDALTRHVAIGPPPSIKWLQRADYMRQQQTLFAEYERAVIDYTSVVRHHHLIAFWLSVLQGIEAAITDIQAVLDRLQAQWQHAIDHLPTEPARSPLNGEKLLVDDTARAWMEMIRRDHAADNYRVDALRRRFSWSHTAPFDLLYAEQPVEDVAAILRSANDEFSATLTGALQKTSILAFLADQPAYQQTVLDHLKAVTQSDDLKGASVRPYTRQSLQAYVLVPEAHQATDNAIRRTLFETLKRDFASLERWQHDNAEQISLLLLLQNINLLTEIPVVENDQTILNSDLVYRQYVYSAEITAGRIENVIGKRLPAKIVACLHDESAFRDFWIAYLLGLIRLQHEASAGVRYYELRLDDTTHWPLTRSYSGTIDANELLLEAIDVFALRQMIAATSYVDLNHQQRQRLDTIHERLAEQITAHEQRLTARQLSQARYRNAWHTATQTTSTIPTEIRAEARQQLAQIHWLEERCDAVLMAPNNDLSDDIKQTVRALFALERASVIIAVEALLR